MSTAAVLVPSLDARELARLARYVGGKELAGGLALLNELKARYQQELRNVHVTLPIVGPDRDEWTQAIRDGRAYSFSVAAPAVAARFSGVQLRNDIAAGRKRILVRSIRINTAAGTVSIRTATGNPSNIAGEAGVQSTNSRRPDTLLTASGNLPPEVFYTGIFTAFDGATVGDAVADTLLESFIGATGTTDVADLAGGFLFDLLPGSRLQAWGHTVNSAVNVTFRCIEYPEEMP